MNRLFEVTPPLSAWVQIAQQQGLDVGPRLEGVSESCKEAARGVFGESCSIDVELDVDTGEAQVFIGQRVGGGRGEVALERVVAVFGDGWSVGDELLCSADSYDEAGWSLLGLDDAQKSHRSWLAQKGRLLLAAFPECHLSTPELVSLVGDALRVPELSESTAILASAMARRAPEARQHYAGSPDDDLAVFGRLGPHADGLVDLMRALGPETDGFHFAFAQGQSLLSARDATAAKATLDTLEADGAFAKWDRNEWWNPEWFPFTGDRDHACLGSDGSVVSYAYDGPERDVVAPAIRDWLGVLALGVVAGLITWDRALGFAEQPVSLDGGLRELQRLVLPGYPSRRSATPRAG